MKAGLVVFDVLSLLVTTALYWAAAEAAIAAAQALPAGVPVPFAIVTSALVFVLALLAMVAIATAMLPRLEPGSYPLMKGKVFFSWIFRSLLRRVLFIEPLRTVLFNFNVLRYLALRALGARVDFGVNASNDIDVIDPAMLDVRAGTTLGSKCVLAGHYVRGGMLVLGRVRIGPGSLLGAHAMVGPGVTLGARVELQVRAIVSPDVTVEDDGVIGIAACVAAGAHIAKGARVKSGAQVARGERVEASARRSSIESSAAPAV